MPADEVKKPRTKPEPLPEDRTTIIEADSLEPEDVFGGPGKGGFTQYKCIYCLRSYRDKGVAEQHVYVWHMLNGGKNANTDPALEDAKQQLPRY